MSFHNTRQHRPKTIFAVTEPAVCKQKAVRFNCTIICSFIDVRVFFWDLMFFVCLSLSLSLSMESSTVVGEGYERTRSRRAFWMKMWCFEACSGASWNRLTGLGFTSPRDFDGLVVFSSAARWRIMVGKDCLQKKKKMIYANNVTMQRIRNFFFCCTLLNIWFVPVIDSEPAR